MPEETALDATLLSLLACPQDKGPLLLVRDDSGATALYNSRLPPRVPDRERHSGAADR